jgi:lipopolysaccharide transport system permease protein
LTAALNDPAPVSLDPARPVVRLRPRRGWQALDLAELWRYRELLGFLALRDVQVRYKQTFFGAAWAIVQPLTAMLVLAVCLGKLGGMAQRVEVPYPVFLYAGTLPWTFFAATVSAAAVSLVTHANMVQKIYFPRLIMPLSAAGSPLVDYAAASSVLALLMAWYGLKPGLSLLLLPMLVFTLLLAALGVGVLLAGLVVAYRDFRYVIAFLVQVWFFATPAIYYPLDQTPPELQSYQWLVTLNPMNGLIGAFRGAVLGTPIDWPAYAVAVVASALLFVVGVVYFKRVERSFADVI